MAKLWQKSYQLDSNIERFTVGDDYLLDRKLVSADCLGSIAHARMLASIGLLSQEEEKNLVSELRRIISGEDSLSIEAEDEDVHTAIENRLTERLGEAGRKIHTGRSRNDQVLTAMRLYTKAAGYRLRHSLIDLSSALLSLAEGHEFLPLPGRTHLQIAMPSSAGLWASAYAEQLLDDAHLLESALELVDRCPLGSAASYGVPLPLDREMTAGLLGFSGPHHNVLAAQNSRGKLEAAVLDALDQAGITINRLAQDLILFSLPELGYISLPDELCSGSSIMPQKKNPDVLELSRARTAVLSAEAGKIKQIVRGLPSGYQRDLQETKGPFFSGLENARSLFEILGLTVSRLVFHPDRCRAGFTPEIYATDQAIDMVRGGMNFRDAYREVATTLGKGGIPKGTPSAEETEYNSDEYNPDKVLHDRASSGAPGNLGLASYRKQINRMEQSVSEEEQRFQKTLSELAGGPVELLPAEWRVSKTKQDSGHGR